MCEHSRMGIPLFNKANQKISPYFFLISLISLTDTIPPLGGSPMIGKPHEPACKNKY